MPIGAIILVGLVSSLNGIAGSVVHRAAVCAGLGLLHLLVEILGKSGNQCFPDFARTPQGSLSCLGAGDPVISDQGAESPGSPTLVTHRVTHPPRS